MNSIFYQYKNKTEYKNDLKYRTYYLSINIIKYIASLIENKVYQVITNQLLRSVTSIGANIVEAKSSSSKKDFIKFYQIALKSANESKYWLGLLRDALGLDKKVINEFLLEVDEISKMLASSIITLKNKKF